MIGAQTDFFTGTIQPAYKTAVGGAQDVYGQVAPEVAQRAEELGEYGSATGQLLGAAGAGALGSGLAGLSRVFDPQYKQEQLNAAMVAPQLQAQETMARQAAEFGASGQMGSARAALAARRTAENTALQQSMARAQVGQAVEQQRAAAAGQLASIGMDALPAGQQAIAGSAAAAGLPLSTYNQYASVLFGTPSGSYTPQFAGTRGSEGKSTGYNVGASWSPF
jgi:hypothetical protein